MRPADNTTEVCDTESVEYKYVLVMTPFKVPPFLLLSVTLLLPISWLNQTGHYKTAQFEARATGPRAACTCPSQPTASSFVARTIICSVHIMEIVLQKSCMAVREAYGRWNEQYA